MAPKLDPEYSKMLSTQAPPTDGSRKSAIDSLQKQIDFHVGEANRLRYAQNLHVAVSRLPTELLAEVFLCIAESGLQDGDARFAARTFAFLQVCRRWNEVAVSFPQLWGWWVAGAVKAWPLFHSRSKDTPLSLICRSRLPASAQDTLAVPATPRRIHRLDFNGTSEELTQLLGAFGSSPCNISSIQLKVFPFDDHEPREHLARFLSLPFPKLSRLDLENLLPVPSPSIFAPSCLTSLKLSLPSGKKKPFTLPQFSQIFRQHTNLRELCLKNGAIPFPGSQNTPPVPFTLPQLADLRLDGNEAAILGFIGLIDMSSPLEDVVIHFGNTTAATLSALFGTVKRVLVQYYECEGLDQPRKINRLSISYYPEKNCLVFNSRSPPAPMSSPTSNLKLQFSWINNPMRCEMKEMFSVFPLDDVQELAIEGLFLTDPDVYRGIFQKTKNLSQLRLDKMYLSPALDALSRDSYGEPRQAIPKLKLLILSHLDSLFEDEQDLLDVLEERRDHNIGLQKLVVRSCRVHKEEYKLRLGQLVKNVKWDNVTVVDSDYVLCATKTCCVILNRLSRHPFTTLVRKLVEDSGSGVRLSNYWLNSPDQYEGTDDEPDSDELRDNLDDYELEKYYRFYR